VRLILDCIYGRIYWESISISTNCVSRARMYDCSYIAQSTGIALTLNIRRVHYP
jgi:hypothetical protein